MSYILDALKKAEKERDLGSVPKLETVHDSPADSGRRPVLWMLIGIGLLANAVVLAWWLWPDQRTEPADTAAISATPAVIAPQQPVPVAPPSVPAPQAVMAPPAPVAGEPALPMPATPPVSAPVVQQPAVPVMADGASSTPVPVPAPAPYPAPAPVPPATAEPQAEVPLLRDMPDSIRGPLAGLSIDVHVYADSPAERFVLVNMRKYREGEQLAAGPLLELITPQGMILRQHGQRFRVDR